MCIRDRSSDGKTFIAILFALVAQELGKKVLLIDMDTEKTTLTKKFFNKKFNHPGFTNLRKNKFSTDNIDEYIITDEKNNIDIIPSGNDKSEFVDDIENFELLIKSLSKNYDMILCDTMPITYNQQSMLNSKFMNSILTIKHNATPIALSLIHI